MAPGADFEAWLRGFLSARGGIAGTVHLRAGEALSLVAAVNIPPKVVEITRVIPRGKGMAGLAWERSRAVSTCDRQTDGSGDVRPGAKAVDARAALVIPVRDSQGDVRGVVGIAFAGERDFSADDLRDFERAAAEVPREGN